MNKNAMRGYSEPDERASYGEVHIHQGAEE